MNNYTFIQDGGAIGMNVNIEELPKGHEYLDGLAGEEMVEAVRRNQDNVNVITEIDNIFIKFNNLDELIKHYKINNNSIYIIVEATEKIAVEVIPESLTRSANLHGEDWAMDKIKGYENYITEKLNQLANKKD